jgi:hypothetical protein
MVIILPRSQYCFLAPLWEPLVRPHGVYHYPVSRMPSEFVDPGPVDCSAAVDLLVREGQDDEEEDEDEEDDEEGEDDGNSDGYSE